MEAKYTTPEEMRNVVLSDKTKTFLVAHRMIEEAGCMVENYMDDLLYDGHKGTDDLWDKVRDLQDEILNLMKVAISGALTDREVTEI